MLKYSVIAIPLLACCRKPISPSGSLSAVLILKSHLQNIRDKLPDLVKEASAQAEELLELPYEKRRTKTLARLRADGASKAATEECPDFHTTLVGSGGVTLLRSGCHAAGN